MSAVLRNIDWTGIHAGESMLAMHIFAQARIDLEDETVLRELGYRSPREDALSFLRGEEDEEGETLLFHWCECAGIDPLTVQALVRHEPKTLIERLEKKCKGREAGSYIPASPGELKAARKTGAMLTEQKGSWAWREWVLVKEGSDLGRIAESAAGEVSVGGEDFPVDLERYEGVCGAGEETAGETEEQEEWPS